MATNLENLQAKAAELSAKAQTIKTPEEAMAFAFQALDAIRDAKESLATETAKIETKDLLTFALPFIPAQYQFLAKAALSVASLFGGGFGLANIIDQPDSVEVTIPAETQAKLDAEAAKLAEAAKAADESATKHKESFEAAIAEMQAAQAAMKEAANKKFVIRGYDKDNRPVTELDFFREPPR